MTTEQREELSLLAALGEADASQLSQLEAELSKDAKFARTHHDRCTQFAAFKEAGEKGRIAPPLPTLSSESRAQLDQARNAAFAKSKSNIIRPIMWITALAACIGIGLFAAKTMLPETHPPILTLAPTGETGTQSPLIVWENATEPEQKYDVWILPKDGTQKDAEALFVSKGVRSPLELSQMKAASAGLELSPDEDYRVLVCYADKGRLAGTASPFKIAKEASPALLTPTTAAEAALLFTELLEKNRPSDVLMLAERLPADLQKLTEIQTLKKVALQRIRQK